MQNDDFKYVLQDTGNVYFGKELTYTEMLERDDVPFKFKAIINNYIAKDADLDKTVSRQLLELDTDTFTYRVFEQLKLSVKICYQKEKRTIFGGKKEKWVHASVPVKQFFDGGYREKITANQAMVEEISISKLALMTISI